MDIARWYSKALSLHLDKMGNIIVYGNEQGGFRFSRELRRIDVKTCGFLDLVLTA